MNKFILTILFSLLLICNAKAGIVGIAIAGRRGKYNIEENQHHNYRTLKLKCYDLSFRETICENKKVICSINTDISKYEINCKKQ